MTIQIRKLATLTSVSLLILLSGFNAYAAPGILPSIPLYNVNSGVDPNIFITTDDSGSMKFEFIYKKTSGTSIFPEDVDGVPIIYDHRTLAMIPDWYSNLIPTVANKPDVWVFYNHNVNKLYYNPNVLYEPWPGLDSLGSALYSDASVTAVRKNPDVNDSKTNKNISNSSASNFYQPVYCTWDASTDTKGTPGAIDVIDDHSCIEIKPGSDVYDSGRTGDEELQNFANWMQYYRNRELSAKNALGVLVNSTESARMGLRYINSGHELDLKPMSDDTNKSTLLQKIYEHSASGGTPLRPALQATGEMFKSNNPASIVSGGENGEGGECQQNFNILMTDGYWNGWDPWNINNEDGDNNTDFDGTKAQSKDGGNYADEYGKTLADVAMYYYETDLSSLPDRVPTSTGIDTNPQQHLVNYTVAFGLTGELPAGADPLSDGFTWPEPVSNNKSTLDDLFHAAYNSRGLYLSADNPQNLLNSLLSAILNITERTNIASAAAITSSQLTTDLVVFLAEYNSVNWRGNVVAKKIKTQKDANGNDVPVPSGQLEDTPAWDAASLLDNRDYTTRTILTYDNTQSKGIPFRWDSPLTDSMKNDLRTSCTTTTTTTYSPPPGSCVNYLNKIYCPVNWWDYYGCTDHIKMGQWPDMKFYCYDPSANNSTTTTSMNCTTDSDDDKAKARLEYLRGDRTNEGKLLDFRTRTNLLGDIVNSGPVYVAEPNLNFPDASPFPTGTSAYSTFKGTSRTPMVYAGSNDGMVHGFNATTGTAQSGQEVLAYIPSYLFSTEDKKGLHYLTDKRYTHAFYNDLQATVSDAYFDSSSTWKTVLVGGARAGGRGYFALDVTNPGDFTENKADSVAMWEFTSDDDADLGFSYSRPQIGMLNDGTWVAVFGNGYLSTNDGKAKLFIVKLEGDTDGDGWTLGTDYIKISTNSTGTVADPNGLGTPALADIDGNGTIDRAYAGDLSGNLWAFDLSGAFSSSGLTLAYTSPLFKTIGAQPVTTKPILSFHPTQPKGTNEPNIMVFFGSGQLLVNDDTEDFTSVNYFYGVWDNGEATNLSTSLTNSDLVEQVWSHSAGSVPTSNAVSYNQDANGDYDHGWYIKLPDAGERSVTTAAVRGNAVIFNSTIPSSSHCSAQAGGWRYAVDLPTGGAPKEAVLDLNNDGVVDDNDIVTTTSTFPPVQQIEDIATDNAFTETVGYTGDQEFSINELQTPSIGRFSWQELLK